MCFHLGRKKQIKLRERSYHISKQTAVPAQSWQSTNAVETPDSECPASAGHCPTLPKHSLYILIQHKGKYFINPCWCLPQPFLTQPRSHPAVFTINKLPLQPHTGQGTLPLSSLYLSYPFQQYHFFIIRNGCLSSALHFLLVWIFNWLGLVKNSSIRVDNHYYIMEMKHHR